MSGIDQPLIVVGASGSAASVAALRWAADEAKRRRARLHVVSSWEEELIAPYANAAAPTPDQQRAAAGTGLATLLRTVFGPVPPAEVTAELTHGLAAHALIDRSAEADLLVLGSASAPDRTGRSLGPVVRACLHGCPCPVVVVDAVERPRHGSPAVQAHRPQPSTAAPATASSPQPGHDRPGGTARR